jgi:flagellar biosynthetic protein FlhB
MAEKPDRDQQTEAPTQKRRKDAAADGDVLVSRELASAMVMLAGIGWLAIAGNWLFIETSAMLRDGLSLGPESIGSLNPQTEIAQLIQPILMPLGSLLGVTLLAAIAGPALLGSLGWRSKAFGFKANRLSPAAGFKRMFGLQGLIELTKSIAKAIALGTIGWWVISDNLDRYQRLALTDTAAAASLLGSSLLTLLLAMLVGLALIALLDVPVQMLQRTRRLRMSREQIKEEMRQSEGSPELKAAQRARQQAILGQSARKAMNEANLLLNNPAHFSVALRYVPGKDFAPVVVARGRDEVALAMRELATSSDVPMLDYPKLTRAIYFTTRVGQTIPEDLYQAVAAILAFVFKLDQDIAKQMAPPEVEVPISKHFDAQGNPLST